MSPDGSQLTGVLSDCSGKFCLGSSGESLGGECGFDGGDYCGVIGGDFRGKAGDDVAVAAYEEFFEVPEDSGFGVGGGSVVDVGEEAVEVFAEVGAGFADGFGLGLDEGLVEGMGFGAGDGDLLEHGEVDAEVGGAEFLNFLVGAGFLGAEVVGGEAEDDEASIFEAGVEGFEGLVLWGEAALRGYVDDEENFAAVVGESEVFASDAVYRNVI